jgi:hypothetical protein
MKKTATGARANPMAEVTVKSVEIASVDKDDNGHPLFNVVAHVQVLGPPEEIVLRFRLSQQPSVEKAMLAALWETVSWAQGVRDSASQVADWQFAGPSRRG